MNSNPYEPTPPRARNLRIPVQVVLPWIYLALLACGIFFGWLILTTLLTNPLAGWGWQNWCFGFIPAAYLLFAALTSVLFEKVGYRIAHLLVPVVMLPLIAVTLLILFATYLDVPNILALKFAWTQVLHSTLLLSLCPVIWHYLAVSIASAARMWRMRAMGSDNHQACPTCELILEQIS